MNVVLRLWCPDVEMKSSQGQSGTSASLRTTERAPISWYHLGKERTKRSQEAASCAPISGHITYRGIRGLKHRNDRIHRTATETAVVTDVPQRQTASERQPARQNVDDQCLRSSDQPRSIHTSSSSSSRRSVSEDRQKSSTASTPRNFFERLDQDKVMPKSPVSSDDQAVHYAMLAGLPQSLSVTNCLNVRPTTDASRVLEDGRSSQRSTAPRDLDACRSNIVTARTRFFEEKSRPSSPATPPQRRSRSATRIDDRWNPSRGGDSPSTPTAGRCLPAASRAVQGATAVQRLGQAAPVSRPESTPQVKNFVVNNETDELKV